MPFILILDNIRSVQNVGAIFRTADAIGVSKVYLTGITPGPLDRFNRPRQDFIKASLGSEKSVAWERVGEIFPLILKLKANSYFIVALEQSPKAVDYKKIKTNKKTALIVGNEVEGISKEVLNSCDAVMEIPMGGHKESLNVSVATGIVLYRLLDQ